MRALVLGGSGSIGTAIVEQLLIDGYEVDLQFNTSDETQLKAQYQNKKLI